MPKVLIITYYWPPSGGSGVQRWMYFGKYLKNFGIIPVVITVDEKKASYKYIDKSFVELVKDVEVHKTDTWEPLKLYSKLTSGDSNSAIPLGFTGEHNPTLFQRISRAIRGNLFIPDSRVGWVRFAFREAKKIIKEQGIDIVITTGPPHSSHLVGLKLKKYFNVIWFADFRDPWTDLYYNKLLYRTKFAQKRDERLERNVLQSADLVLTVGPSMKKHLIQKGEISPEKIHFIYNGYDENDFEGLDVLPDPNYFTITHIGVLSPSQPIDPFLKAIRYLIDNNHPVSKFLKLRIVGTVSQDLNDEIRSKIPEVELDFIEYVPKRKAIEYMMTSNLLFNSLPEMDGSELLISGKLMEYIAAQKPILCLGNPNGDAANLLKHLENSQVFDRKDSLRIVEYLDKLFYNWINKKQEELKSNNSQLYSRRETARQLADIIMLFNEDKY